FDTLQAVATTQFTGTITVPASYTLSQKSLNLRLSQFATINLLTDGTANAAPSYYTPNIGGATLLFSVTAIKTVSNGTVYFKNGLSPGATGVAITIPAAPDESLPVDNATGVDTTVTFSWTPMTGAIHLLVFSSSGNPQYIVLTSGTSATIPNLKALGLGLPSAQTYTWAVYGFGPFTSADDAAGAAGFLSILTNPTVLTGDAFYGISASRHFTSAP
ncbi:MAG TPA: carboxypeptidase regulatory-like domain-containing protein, partial [Bacteroidota bacterium]|nr:carboxypeptidase regulatory-like domain-containing protein [Bacteroidota bacterium]